MKTKYINVLVAASVLVGGSLVGGMVLNNASATDAEATGSSLVSREAKISSKRVPTAKKVAESASAKGHAASSSKPAVSSASSSKASVAATAGRSSQSATAQSSQQSSQKAQTTQQSAPAASVSVSSSTQQHQTTQRSSSTPTHARNTISFLGVTVPVIQGNMSITTAPSGNRAQTWGGQTHLSVTDGQSTHIIGHNTTSFGQIIGLAVGSAVSVTDGNGNTKTYHVTKTLNVTDQGKVEGTNTDVYNQIVSANQGEQVVLQTCISSTINRLVWAR